jgi:hypothetical protein
MILRDHLLSGRRQQPEDAGERISKLQMMLLALALIVNEQTGTSRTLPYPLGPGMMSCCPQTLVSQVRNYQSG